MTDNNLKWLLAIAVIVLVLLGITYYNSRGDYDTLNQKYAYLQQGYDTLNSQFASTQAETNQMRSTLATTQEQIQTLTNQLQQKNTELQQKTTQLSQKDNELNSLKTQKDKELVKLQQEIAEIKSQLKLYQDTGVKVFNNVQPPYAKAPYASIHLVNNSYATNPTWIQLLSFLNSDTTETIPYSSTNYVCGNFAERLHNNAEVAGIQSAWVYIGLANNSDGHAVNAFNAVDRGLVYIDDTGITPQIICAVEYPTGKSLCSTPEDKVAYIQVGKESGALTIQPDLTLNYSEYTDAVNKLDDYSSQVKSYNNYIKGKTFYIGTAECNMVDQWYNRLTEMEKTLRGVWEPMGIVTEVEIYW